MEPRLLAMDGDQLCLGVRQLGCTTESNSSMGGRPLVATPRRLGLDRGPLAVIRRQIAAQGWDSLRFSENDELSCIVSSVRCKGTFQVEGAH